MKRWFSITFINKNKKMIGRYIWKFNLIFVFCVFIPFMGSNLLWLCWRINYINFFWYWQILTISLMYYLISGFLSIIWLIWDYIYYKRKKDISEDIFKRWTESKKLNFSYLIIQSILFVLWFYFLTWCWISV